MTTLEQFAAKSRRAGKRMAAIPKRNRTELGKMGKEILIKQAGDLFGPDRRFSGSTRSRKAKRKAYAGFRYVGNDAVAVYPSGDPWYIFLKGRNGGAPIYPTKKSGKKSVGRDREHQARHTYVGTLDPRPNLLDPSVRKIGQKAPNQVAKTVGSEIVISFR